MKKNRQGLHLLVSTVIAAVMLGSAVLPVNAAEPTEQQLLVDQTRIAFQGMITEYGMSWLRENFHQAKAVLIVPRLLRAGLILGGFGGRGVLLVKDANTGQWSQPAFYTIGAGSIGIQFGGETAEVIMMVRTQKAVDKLLSSSFKLGGDATMTAGPIGQGLKSTVMADIYSFSRTQGLFWGVSLEGAVITPRDEWNTAYYGRPVSPADILVSNMVNNPGAVELRNAVANAASKK